MALKSDLTVLNSIKNATQYLLGTSVYVFIFAWNFSFLELILGVLSLVFAYNAIYLYNDLVDYEEDKKNFLKRKMKALARGAISKKTAKKLMYIFLVSGVVLSLFTNAKFVLLILAVLFLNFLYSAPKIRFRNNVVTFSVVMFLIQFLKFSSGWVAINQNFLEFPIFFIGAISMFYVCFGYSYKNPDLGLKELANQKLAYSLFLIGAVLYGISFLKYTFKLQLLIAPILFLMLLIPWLVYGKKDLFKRTFALLVTGILVMFLIVVSFLVL